MESNLTKEKMSNGYACVPNRIAFDRNIKNEVGLLIIISSLCASTGECWATNEKLGSLLDCDISTVSNKIKKLVENNYISVRYQKTGKDNMTTVRYISLTDLSKIDKNTNIDIGENTKLDISKNTKFDIGKNTKYNNTTNNNNTNENNNTNNNICDKNHLLVAETIKGIVESKSSKQINNRVLNGWIDEIRKLESVDKVPIEKIVNVAKWYAIHYNDNKYIPVVESGKSFREKFVKLEQAIQRQNPIKEKNDLQDIIDFRNAFLKGDL